MFVGRKDEQNRLEDIYRADKSSIVVLYGRERIGKTTLALRFAEGKKFLYYEAVEAMEDLQTEIMRTAFGSEKETASLIVREGLDRLGEGKKVIILDEFHLMAQHGTLLTQLLIDLLTAAKAGETAGNLMIVLISSSVKWIENEMVGSMGAIARLITGFIKLGELSFQNIVQMLPKTQVADCILVKAVLGGVPGLIRHWRESSSARENILRLLLSRDAVFANEAEHLLKTELRELPCYNRILCAMASGRTKMNDIYAVTGFSRAKISVYIKNLIHMGVAEKVFSYDDSGHENLKKGLYRIKDPFIAFYYAFVFPNRSRIAAGKADPLYDELVAPKLDEVMRPYFADVCREFLQIMSEQGMLGMKFTDYRSWHGKQGTIDIIATDGKETGLAALCVFSPKDASRKDFEHLKELSDQAGIKPKAFYLFAKTGFDEELKKFAVTGESSLKLVSLGDL